MSTKRALFWVMFWALAAILFDAGVFFFSGRERALEFLGGYVIEQSLSMDNLFLFLSIFSGFGIKPAHQSKVLRWGILGAVVFRLLFVLLGITVISRFHGVLYLFGVVLILSGFQMLLAEEGGGETKNRWIVRALNRVVPVTDRPAGDRFFVRRDHKIYATPLFAALILIEFTDILFAMDSIPSIFSITTDPFIVYTSNLFAMLGLRNLYFVLGKLHETFSYVRYGVAAILVFTGVKLSLLLWDVHIPTLLSLQVILLFLIVSIIASLLFPRKIQYGRS